MPNSRELISEGGVRGVFHRPAMPSGDILVLTHGAGSSCEAPLLVALAEAFAARGIAVLRCDLPFRQAAPAGPPRTGAAPRDREGLAAAVGIARRLGPGRRFLGGHSYGGRQASILAADEPELADGLLCLAYPLHPPGRPQEPRTAHFPRLRVAALFVHGERDPFGTLAELRQALASIPAPTRLLAIGGAGHDLAAGRRRPASPVDLRDAVVRSFLDLVNPSRSA